MFSLSRRFRSLSLQEITEEEAKMFLHAPDLIDGNKLTFGRPNSAIKDTYELTAEARELKSPIDTSKRKLES